MSVGRYWVASCDEPACEWQALEESEGDAEQAYLDHMDSDDHD